MWSYFPWLGRKGRTKGLDGDVGSSHKKVKRGLLLDGMQVEAEKKTDITIVYRKDNMLLPHELGYSGRLVKSTSSE